MDCTKHYLVNFDRTGNGVKLVVYAYRSNVLSYCFLEGTQYWAASTYNDVEHMMNREDFIKEVSPEFTKFFLKLNGTNQEGVKIGVL